MFFEYPYTDLYNLNLDWMIKAMKEMQAIVEPLNRIVNSVNGQTGDVEITKSMLLGILGSMVETFNGRSGAVTLTESDVNSTLIDIVWTSSPGDTINDLDQYYLDTLYRNGKRILIFYSNLNVPDRIYFLKWNTQHAFPQLYSPTSALAGVASFNGETGNVEVTGSDLDTSDTNTTSIAESIRTNEQKIDLLKTSEAFVEDGDTATQKTYSQGEFILWKGLLYTVNAGGIEQGTAIAGKVTLVQGGGLNQLSQQIGTLNENLKIIRITETTDLNTLRPVQVGYTTEYVCDRASLATNRPSGVTAQYPFRLFVFFIDEYVGQVYVSYSSNGKPDVYMRQQYYVSSTQKPFGEWNLLTDKVETTTFTFAGNVIDNTVDPSYIRKTGHVVTLELHGRTTTEIASYTELGAIIPEGFRPKSVIFPIGLYGNIAYTFNIRPQGAIINNYPQPIEANKSILLSCSYIV